MESKINDHRTHLCRPKGLALLAERGDSLAQTSEGTDYKEGESERNKGCYLGKCVLHRAHFKDCLACMRNHGNLWQVINVLAGSLNHSWSAMAQCLTV